VDHLHIVRLANQALDEVRRSVQQDTLGHRGHAADPLYRIRRRLLCAHENLAPGAFDRVLAWLEAGDPAGEVGAAYLAKELLRRVYETTDPMQARRRLVKFYQHIADAEVPELTRLATTISRWEKPLLRWHLTGLSNGPVEGTNLIVKNTKRSGFGFRNFENYRHRVLLRTGSKWKTPTAPPLHPAPTAAA
jgi:transposase